jgi:hypothetical protein
MEMRRWGWIFVQSFLIALFFLAGLEGVWRFHGFQPHISNSYELWADAMQRAINNRQQTIAFIGASRSMQNIHIPTLRSQLPNYIPVQLGLSMGSPIPTMKFLAESSKFNGTLVVDVMPSKFFVRPTDVDKSRADYRYISIFQSQQNDELRLSKPWINRWERELKFFLQQNIAILSGYATPKKFVDKLILRRPVRVPFYWVTRDRMQIMDYSRIDVEKFRDSRPELHSRGLPLDTEELLKLIERVSGWTEQIQKRGGRVIFIRYPTQGAVRAIEVERFPDSHYWDIFATYCNAKTIDTNRYHKLNCFQKTDDDHIDSEEAPLFTTRIIEYILTAYACPFTGYESQVSPGALPISHELFFKRRSLGRFLLARS